MVGMLAILLTFGLVLAGCATGVDAGRYDNASPAENDSILIIGKNSSSVERTMITEFDGQTVSWVGEEPLFGGLIGGDLSFTIRVPAGEHALTGGPVANQQGVQALKYLTSTKFKFEAGKAYHVDVVNRNFKITETTL